MKKTSIAFAAFTALFCAVSCQEKNGPEPGKFTSMTFCAVSEGINAADASTKADMVYKYDVLWRTGDKILVKNDKGSATFTLAGGEGTTKGTFSCTQSPFKAGDEVEAFYPESIVSGTDLVWPATLTNNQTVPMYCKKTLSGTENEPMNFNSLGSVFQLTFSTTSEDIVLMSIEVKADEAMSGKFSVSEDGRAVIDQSGGDKPGIILELGDEGVALGVTAKKFNIAIPAGIYTNLTITFAAKNGKKCTIKATKPQSIEHNTVSTLAISGEFSFPAGMLPGEFSVSDDGGITIKKVHFSKGNLQATYDKNASAYTWGFAANQYDCIGNNAGNTTIDSQADGAVVDLFGWSTLSTNYGINISITPPDYSGNFKDWGTAVGDGRTWRTLTQKEWKFLLGNHQVKCNVSVCGESKCLVIAPADFEGEIQASYDETSWPEAEAAGLVCLPSAGYRNGTKVVVILHSSYWSSSPSGAYNAYYLKYEVSSYTCDDSISRFTGSSVRLVTEL